MVCLGNKQRSFCHFWDCTMQMPDSKTRSTFNTHPQTHTHPSLICASGDLGQTSMPLGVSLSTSIVLYKPPGASCFPCHCYKEKLLEPSFPYSPVQFWNSAGLLRLEQGRQNQVHSSSETRDSKWAAHVVSPVELILCFQPYINHTAALCYWIETMSIKSWTQHKSWTHFSCMGHLSHS